MNRIIIPDVSFWQDRPDTARQIDFVEMAKVAPAVIIRAGQNVWPDTDFEYNTREAKSAGLPRGTYWFYDSRVSPQKQADKYLETLNGDFGELPIFADFEDRYGGDYGGWDDWYVFLESLKSCVDGHQIGLYTAHYYWKERTVSMGIPTASLNYFKHYPLWVAHYGVDNPTIPLPWTEWMLWQYTDNGDGKPYGVESLNIDLNYYNGDLQSFTDKYGGVVVTPPDTGEKMATHKAIKKASSYTYINIRDNPSSSGKDIGNFNDGEVAQGTMIGTDPASWWMRLETVDDVAIVTSSYIAAYLCDITPIPDVPTPELDPNIEVKVTLFDDWTGQVDTLVNSEIVNTWSGRLKPPPAG